MTARKSISCLTLPVVYWVMAFSIKHFAWGKHCNLVTLGESMEMGWQSWAFKSVLKIHARVGWAAWKRQVGGQIHHQVQFPELNRLIFTFFPLQAKTCFLKSNLCDISHRAKPSSETQISFLWMQICSRWCLHHLSDISFSRKVDKSHSCPTSNF